MATISGHPSLEAHRDSKASLRITVCASCERLSSVLFLSQDRWFCTGCRSEGDARPTQVSLHNPSRR